MKKQLMTRRFGAILLILAFVLSMVPITAGPVHASTQRTVYFENTGSWSQVNIYFWADGNTGYVSWPGQSMKLYSGNIYSYDLPAGVQYVIFNNGSTQTPDLVLPADKNLYHYASGSWSAYGCLHSWDEGTVLTAATCTTSGEISYTCTLCAQQKTVVTDPLGHQYKQGTCTLCGDRQPVIYFDATGSGWSSIHAYTWTGSTPYNGSWPGTLMEPVEGVANLYCITISAEAENIIFNNGSGGDGNQTADLSIPTDGRNLYASGQWSKYDTCTHNWGQGTVTTPASCTTEGVRTYTCSLCGETKTEVIASTGHSYSGGTCSNCGLSKPCVEHSWDEGQVTTEQGCWTFGVRTYRCTICGETKEETIYPGHDYYVAEIIPATCIKTGKQITRCTRCAYVYDTTLPKVDHSYTAGENVPPTCTEDGYTLMTCDLCGAEKKGNPVYHEGHQWSGNTCTVCGETCEHRYEDGICTACGKGGPAYVQGYYEISTPAQLYWFADQVNSGNHAICGKLVTDIDLKGGSWTSIGYYLSDTKVPDTVAYTGTFDGQGHTVSNFVTAGTDNEGLFGYCSSAVIKNVGVINAKVTGWRAGAVAGYPLTSQVINCFAQNCTIIGKTTNSVATLSGTVYIAPIASPQGGIVQNCYALDCTLLDETNLDVFTSPVGGTDTQNGYYCNTVWNGTFSSERNSTMVTRQQLASGEVTWMLNKGVTDGSQGWYQTCGEGLPGHSGETVYQVTGCNSNEVFYSNDPGAAGDHSFDTGSVTTQPTCTTDGVQTFTCTGCGASYKEALPALGHRYEQGICTLCGKAEPGYSAGTVSGNIQGFSELTGVTVVLTLPNEETPSYTAQITESTYSFTNIPAGDYLLTVSAERAATRTYLVEVTNGSLTLDIAINLLGDANGDFKVNINDVAMVYAHTKGTTIIEDEYAFLCADVNGDGAVNIIDTAMLYSHIKGTISIW